MKAPRRAWKRLAGSGREAEMAEEFEAHLRLLIDDNVRIDPIRALRYE